MHAWSDLAERKKRGKKKPFCHIRSRVQNASFVAALRAGCLLMQNKTLCHQPMTVPDARCAPPYGNAQGWPDEREMFAKFPISHYVIDHWGILLLLPLPSGQKRFPKQNNKDVDTVVSLFVFVGMHVMLELFSYFSEMIHLIRRATANMVCRQLLGLYPL